MQPWLTGVVYALACGLTHLFSPVLSRLAIPHFLHIPHAQRLAWYNRLVSLLHASLMSALVIYYWIAINPSLIINNTITPFQRYCHSMFLGYLAYDICYELVSGKSFDMLAHHLMGVLVHLITVYFNSGICSFYLMVVYIAELSTPFLHITWLLYNLVDEKNLLFHTCSVLLLTLFFTTRVCLGPYMIIHIVQHRRLWRGQLMSFYFCTLTSIVYVMLNIKWFVALVTLALKPLPTKKA